MSCNVEIINVRDISKSYKIYHDHASRLFELITPNFFHKFIKKKYDVFWAIKNISFSLKKAETVGIIGRNGSGKSTLLQLICGILVPSDGLIQLDKNLRIAALLELGSGFNPEFSGIDNIYLYASILGLKKDEIQSKLPSILSFADIGEYVYQPIKTYSSGMSMRLAFSVAISVDPEILIVDEALAVGDELFQRKCFSQIEILKKRGVTILFVSHSGSQIVELCDRAILIDQGELIAQGNPKEVVDAYHKLLFSPKDLCALVREEIRTSQHIEPQSEVVHTNKIIEFLDFYDENLRPQSTVAYESQGAIISEPSIYNMDGTKVNHINCGRYYQYIYKVRFISDASLVRFGMLLKTKTGYELFGATSSRDYENRIQNIKSGSEFIVNFRFKCIFNPGMYYLNAGVMCFMDGEEKYLHRIIDAIVIRVLDNPASLNTLIVDALDDCKVQQVK